MNKPYCLLFALALFLSFADVPGQSVGQVKISNQTWMTKNLAVSTFLNGDPIPHVKTNEAWEKAAREKKPAWCYYENDTESGAAYGRLYNWYAVNDPRGLAPKGWRIPTDEEWTALINHLGGDAVAGGKIKAEGGWGNSGKSNSSGLSVWPGGCRHVHGRFYGYGTLAYFWSGSSSSPENGWYRTVSADYTQVFRHGTLSKGSGLSVRCVKE